MLSIWKLQYVKIEIKTKFKYLFLKSFHKLSSQPSLSPPPTPSSRRNPCCFLLMFCSVCSHLSAQDVCTPHLFGSGDHQHLVRCRAQKLLLCVNRSGMTAVEAFLSNRIRTGNGIIQLNSEITKCHLYLL